MAKTIQEIIRGWQQEQAGILQQQFRLHADARELSQQEAQDLVRGVTGLTGSDEEVEKLVRKGAATKASQMRADYKLAYEAAYEDFLNQLQLRKAEVELALFKPARDADPALIFEVAQAPLEKLRGMMELALQSGGLTSGDVAFAECWRREDAGREVAFYSEARSAADENWAALYEELIEAESVTPIGDISGHFEQMFTAGAEPGPWAEMVQINENAAALTRSNGPGS